MMTRRHNTACALPGDLAVRCAGEFGLLSMLQADAMQASCKMDGRMETMTAEEIERLHKEFCGYTVWQNEDGICEHAACEGWHLDCGELVGGDPDAKCQFKD